MLAKEATPPSLQMLMVFSLKGIYLVTLTGQDTKWSWTISTSRVQRLRFIIIRPQTPNNRDQLPHWQSKGSYILKD